MLVEKPKTSKLGILVQATKMYIINLIYWEH